MIFKSSDWFTPVECTKETCSPSADVDRCEMGNKANGFTTYTFLTLNDEQYCFTVYHPVNRIGQILPVVMTAQCYAKNKLRYNYANMESLRDEDNKAARHYGFARISLSSPRGNWQDPSK